MNEDIYIELVQKDLLNTLDDQERVLLETWKSDSAENQRLYESLYKAWEISGDYGANIEIDVEQDYQKVFSKIKKNKKEAKIIPRSWLAIAATALLLISSYFLLRQSDTIHIVADVNQYVVILPDESKLILEKGSELSYKNDFLKNRILEFEGSALMDIVHNPSKSMKIFSPKMTTEILGTKFFIEDKKNASSSVQLIHGKVLVVNRSTRRQVELQPNERAEINLSNIDSYPGIEWQSFDWFDQHLNFQAVPLPNVLSTLESYYNVSITAEDQLNECTFSGNLSNQNIDDLLDSIAKLYGAELTLNDENYMILGGTCR